MAAILSQQHSAGTPGRASLPEAGKRSPTPSFAGKDRMGCTRTQLALRLRGCVLRLFPDLANAMATACLIAFFFVGGWLAPIDPSFFQSSTSVLILLLTTGWLDPFLSGMIFLLSAASIGRALHQSRRCNRIEIRPVSIAPC